MKTTYFCLFRVICLVYCFSHMSHAAPPCGTVDMKAASCIGYARGVDARPSAACCTGLQQLARSAKTVDDKKAICRCLKAGVKNVPGVQDKLLSKIPGACSIRVGFPVSLYTDCDKLH